MIMRNNNNSWLFPIMSNLFDTPIMGGDVKLVDRSMRTDVIEKDNEYLLSIELAGFKKEQVSLNIEDNYLVVCAEQTNQNDEDDGAKYIRRERSTKSLKRAFYIGDGVDDGKITASMTDGVLKIVLPKKQPEAPEKKSINID